MGEFRILGELGRGGMGVVYEAEQEGLRRRVALKVLPAELCADERMAERFRREAEAAGKLRHSGIVTVHAYGIDGGRPWFAMELVEGGSLAELVHEHSAGGRAFDVTRAVDLAARVAEALEHAHGRGMLHRDVKPANVLLEEDGTPRLSDFGLVLELDAPSLTSTGEILGSLPYASPEQVFGGGERLDARSDVFSLGVTLFELLTGELPHGGRTSSSILGALRSGEFTALGELRPDAPPALEAVLARALSVDPAHRPATAGALAVELRASLAPGAVPLHAVARRRRPWAIVLTLGALLALALVVWRPWRAAPVASGGSLPLEQLEELAAGTHAAADDLLQSWMVPALTYRRVVARDAASPLELQLAFGRVDPPPPADLWVAARLEYRVDGAAHDGPWSLVSAPSSAVYGFRHELRTMLGEAASKGTARLGIDVRLRVLRHAGSYAELEEQLARDPQAGDGAARRWSFDEATIFLYDTYPDDYPEALDEPALNERMAAIWTPDEVSIVTDSQRTLRLLLQYAGRPPDREPVPLACELELSAAPDGPLIARGSFSALQQSSGESAQTYSVLLELGAQSVDQAAFLLGLESGRLESVHLVFRPSRLVALETSGLDVYWGVALDVNVPVAR